MFHTPEEAYIIGSLASLDPRSGLSGLMHIWVDRKCSRDKRFKKLLEFAAHQDYMMEKAMRKFAKQIKKRK